MTLVRAADGGIVDTRVPLWLYKLLARATLSAPVVTRLGPEDRVSIAFADRCRAWSMNGALKGVWTHIPHEVGGGRGRGSEVRYAVAKALGLITGSGDFVFTRGDASLWLEAKRPKLTKKVHGRADSGGQLTDEQVGFCNWCEKEGVPYRVFTSADEGEALLRFHGFL